MNDSLAVAHPRPPRPPFFSPRRSARHAVAAPADAATYRDRSDRGVTSPDVWRIVAWGRLLIGAVLLAVLGGGLTAAPAGAQGDGAGSLVVYTYACPTGWDRQDIAACRENPQAGVGYTAVQVGQDQGVAAETDADGVATIALDGLTPGDLALIQDLPAGYGPEFVVECSQDYVYGDGAITLTNVSDGAFVTCEWFTIPTAGPGGDGSITIEKFACPKDWGGEDYQSCRANPQPGVSFTAVAAGQDNGVGGTTDASGVVSFPLFPADLPGDVSVVEHPPAGYATFEVACEIEPGIAADYDRTETGIVLHGLEAGDEIACAWFNIPAGDPTPDPTPTRAPAPVVGKLPNTGIGSVNQNQPTIGGVLQILGAVGCLVTAATFAALRLRRA